MSSLDDDEASEDGAVAGDVSGVRDQGCGVVAGGDQGAIELSTLEIDLNTTGSSPVSTPAKPIVVSHGMSNLVRKRTTEDQEDCILSDVVRAWVEKKAMGDVELFPVGDVRCLDLKHLISLTQSLCEALRIENPKLIYSRGSVIAALLEYATPPAEARTSYEHTTLVAELAEHHEVKAVSNKSLYGVNKKRVKAANFAFRGGFVKLMKDKPTFAFTNKHRHRWDNKRLTPADVALAKITDLLTDEQYQVFRVDFSTFTANNEINGVCTL